MSTRSVESREYKVMLRPDLFAGDETALLHKAGEFWKAFTEAIEDIVLDTDGDLDSITKKRAISFFDTADRCLRKSDYMFRERQDMEGSTDEPETEVTLKFRHPDRYLAQGRNMDASVEDDGETKLEEDIKSPFQSLFSHSTTQPVSPEDSFKTMSDIAALYPDVEESLECYEPDEIVTRVGDFTAREVVIAGGDKDADFEIRSDSKVEAECALVVWYDLNGSETEPVIAEFSFRYGDKKERYPAKMVQRAYEAFQCLQEELAEWLDPESMTKTAYVYSRGES